MYVNFSYKDVDLHLLVLSMFLVFNGFGDASCLMSSEKYHIQYYKRCGDLTFGFVPIVIEQ